MQTHSSKLLLLVELHLWHGVVMQLLLLLLLLLLFLGV
jgi:hypothetical protein